MQIWTKLILTLSVFCLSGCLSYSAERGIVEQTIASPILLEQIEPGVTTTNWLVDQFGQPQAVRSTGEATQVWQYENVTRSATSVRALPLLAIDLSSADKVTYNFEIADELIVKYWQEN